MTIPYKVMVRGIIYDNAHACAEANGVSVGTVRNKIANGLHDTIGAKTNPNYHQEMLDWKEKQHQQRFANFEQENARLIRNCELNAPSWQKS